MAYINNSAWGLFLENIKGALRPIFQKVQHTIDLLTPDKPSTLAMGVFDGFTIAYRKNTTDELVFNYSFSRDIFFAGAPEYQPQEDHILIDVGAHIGTFSIYAASKLKRGHVYAIEPSADSANYLRINVALNRCDNVSVHQLALADREGAAFLYYDTGTWGHSTVSAYSGTGEFDPLPFRPVEEKFGGRSRLSSRKKRIPLRSAEPHRRAGMDYRGEWERVRRSNGERKCPCSR